MGGETSLGSTCREVNRMANSFLCTLPAYYYALLSPGLDILSDHGGVANIASTGPS